MPEIIDGDFQEKSSNHEDVFDQIERLKKETDTVILAHYYQEDDIQDIADFIGDSLDLSRKAQSAKEKRILFCGVHFMAETAKILNPEKTVLVPDMKAGCSLADNCKPNEFQAFIEAHPDHLVISYINCSADVKAMSDIIVTSSNAVQIVDALPRSQKIIFAPDKYLGAWVAKQTGRHDMILWEGSCIVHENFSHKQLVKLRVQHNDAKIIAHPECPQELLNEADFIGSTRKLLNFISEDESQKYIILTEAGIIHQMKKSQPHKDFIAGLTEDESCHCNLCPFMRLNTLEKVHNALITNEPQIHLPEETRIRAEKSLLKMLELS